MSTVNSGRFVGRQPELNRLTDAARGLIGAQTTWLIGGEAGVGKTRLIQEFNDTIDPDRVAVAVGACLHTAHGSLPFVAIIEAMRQLCRTFDEEEIVRALRQTPELAAILPDFVDGATAEERAATTDEGAQLRLFDAIAGLIGDLARRRRVCIVLEDLHWADRSTNDLFVFLGHNLAGSDATLVGTYRSDEMSRTHPFRPVLAELDRSPLVEHLILEPFSAEELDRFATSILGQVPTARMLDEVSARSGGNAFFAAEVLDALRAGRHSVRPELADLILARIETLSAPTQSILRLVSAGGGSVRDELIGIVTERPEDELEAGLREAIENQTIELTSDGLLRFRHALMQEAVYATLLPRERQRAHARYADALSSNPRLSATKQSCDGELAWHLREAREFSRALRASIVAARSSSEILAFAEALNHMEIALELWDRTEQEPEIEGIDRLAAVRWAAQLADTVGDYPRAIQFHRAAIADAGDRRETERALLHLQLGRALQSAGYAAESLTEYERAIDAVPAEPPTKERAQALAGYGQQLMLTRRGDEAQRALHDAIEMARATGTPRIEGQALNSLGSILLHSGRHDEGQAMLLEALAIAEREHDVPDRLRVYVNLASGYNNAGNLTAAEEAGRTGLSLAIDLGHERGFGFFIAANLAETLKEMGRWEESADVAAQVKRPEGNLPLTWMFNQQVDRAVRSGQIDEARDVLAAIDVVSIDLLDPQIVPHYWMRVADLAVIDGNHDEARRAVEQGLATSDGLSHDLMLRGRAVEIEVGIDADPAARPDAVAQASAHLAAMEAAVTNRSVTLDTKSFRMRALLTQARAEVASAAGEDASTTWLEAASLWNEGPFPWHRARCELRLASASLQRGERDTATALLTGVRDTAATMGALPLEREATTLIDQAGLLRNYANEGNGDTAGVLTERELDVIRLVAEGQTNRQIGEQLFISPKTVSVHVSRIFQKLRVENRTEAAAAARRAGLV